MIRIQNIYYMLSYAFQVLNEDGYKQVATEEFENAAELCTAILIKGVSSQLKRGLGKEYIVQTEELSSLRGKIDISASVKEQTMLRKRLVCNYDEFSVNSYMNRIIRTTMDTLIRSNISKDRKKQLRKLLIYFAEVEPLNRESINWKLQFNKNNQTYEEISGYSATSIQSSLLKGLSKTTKAVGKIVERIPVVGDTQADETLIAAGEKLGDMGTEKIRKQMRQLIERQSNFVRPFIDNIDTVNRLNNNPVQLLVDKDNLYIATIA